MATEKKPLDIEALWQIERLGTPSLAPDGAQAVASLASYSMKENKGTSSLWLLSTLGGAPRRLTTCGEKDGHPRFSPRGDRIAFTAKRELAGSAEQGKKDEEPQLYLIAPDGGEAVRAATVATGVEDFRWGADGRSLAFVSWVWPDARGAKAQAKRMKEWKERKETGYATSEAQYRHWDHHLPMGRVAHLHMMTLRGGQREAKVRDLFEGTKFELTRAEPDANCFDVSPDGARVVFAFDPAEVKRPDGRHALAEVELKSGRITVIARDDGWDFGAPRYSPDGERVAFTASHQALKHTMPSQLAIWERESGRWQVVSAQWDHEVHAPLVWEEDGLELLFTAEQKGRQHLWRFELASRRAEVLVAGAWVSGFDKAAGTLVTLAHCATHPERLTAHLPGQPPRRIETFNDALLGKHASGRVEEHWIRGAVAAPPAKSTNTKTAGKAPAKADAGDPVQLWLAYPPGFDAKKKYPLLHLIHGGPHTAFGDSWHYRWNAQVFAAAGYVVAMVNYHGSSSFGHAFLDSITHRWGELETIDIEAATHWLLQQPWADAERVFAGGGSYGGFMAAWLNGHVPSGRYAAYVCHAGCFDWVGMFADDAYSWHAKELGAWFWDDMAQVHRQSPHAFAKNMSTPTLVIHGALDYRVPDAQGLAYYNTLKARGVDARLVWFPDENHWILKPRNSRLWYREFFGWLERHDGAKRRRSRGRAGPS